MKAFLVTLMVLAGTFLNASETVVKCWDFDTPGDFQGWGHAGGIQDLRVEDGCLCGTYTSNDPMFTSACFDLAVKPGQVVEIRMKADVASSGELFFTNTDQGRFGGFDGKKMKSWKIFGDGAFHTYRFFPGWSKEGKILKLRMDPGSPKAEFWGKASFAVDSIRIIDLGFESVKPAPAKWDFSQPQTVWTWATENGKKILKSAPIRFEENVYGGWCSLEMAVSAGKVAVLTVENGQLADPLSQNIPIVGDGKMRRYNVPLVGREFSANDVYLFTLQPSDDPAAEVALREIQFSDHPQGPAVLELANVDYSNAILRVDQSIGMKLTLKNSGGENAKNVFLLDVKAPEGMLLPPDEAISFDIPPFGSYSLDVMFAAEKPVKGDVEFSFAMGEKTFVFQVPVEVLPSLNLPKADYVPKPKPVKTDYEIGALYFPGWAKESAWNRISSVAPVRKPVLGWYDEANPEVIDWQIKWALENGIQYFLVDWYWNRGNQYLDHWVKSFYQTRYHKMFKWAMMWANHNGRGSHSEEDQAAVTKFWIENYFNTPEYYTIDGRPVVMIWSPEGMDLDVREIYQAKGVVLKKGEGVKKLLDLSQKMAKEAGLKGIYFIAMKWPEASTAPEHVQWLADAGFEMTSIYHYMDHGGKAENPRFFPFDLCVESITPHWEGLLETGILPFLPNLSTGWDSRPWHGMEQTVIYDRTVEKFRNICQQARVFGDRTGIKRICVAPLNEWGEGSYAEPNREFGFGMYEAIRDTFCEKPAEGWPENYGPTDVGLGPYDLPSPLPQERNKTSWTFDETAEGWNGGTVENGRLVLTTESNDPILSRSLDTVFTTNYTRFHVRLKVTRPEGAPERSDALQLFWGTPVVPISEASSIRLPLIADGEFHDYVFPVATSPWWRGQLLSLRLDPCNEKGCRIEIESMGLE
ncbi:MAG: glycoside hydrolase family 99-like domain-containing protein [Planctomycetia bacterium]|nr:glycoside hydrolase family 99-like domain-containing protein [Planctomycetia bacterium]